MPNELRLTAIYAMTENRVIGRDGGMPWHLPADFAHFKRLSRGRPNIMGRRVWESLGRQALSDRPNIVLSRQPDFEAPGARVARSVAEALELAGDAPEIAVIGGAVVYAEFAPLLTRLEETLIHATLDGDTFMPELGGDWEEVRSTFRPADERNAYDLTFRTLDRRG